MSEQMVEANLEENSSLYPASYQPSIALILKFEQFFRILLCRYNICISCTYRIFGILSPKMYSDKENMIKILNEVLKLAENKIIGSNGNLGEQNIIVDQANQVELKQKENYMFMLGEYKAFVEALEQEVNQEQICWLCCGILEDKFLQECANEVIKKVKSEHYGQKEKYKLNTRIDILFSLKLQIFLNLVVTEIQTLRICDESIIKSFRTIILQLLSDKSALDIKTVFKWKLSHILNNKPQEVFPIISTINEDQNTVIISIDIEQKHESMEQVLNDTVGACIGLERIKNKTKGRVDLEREIHYHANWSQGLLGKIAQITERQWQIILEEQLNLIDKIKNLELSVSLKERTNDTLSLKLSLESENLYFCGKYVKFSRYLSQTPWLIGKERLTQSSLQEEIQRKLLPFFYHASIPLESIEIKFHAGGREDVDVRMLTGGRPFVLEFVNPHHTLDDVKISAIKEKFESEYPEQAKNLPNLENLEVNEESVEIKCKLLELYINASTELAKVNSFNKTTPSFISKELKQAEIEKIKHYVCYIKSEQPFTPDDKTKIEALHNLEVVQKTPVRVLHRRTLMFRDKMVFKMIFHHATNYSAVLEIWASAGTYIKEFVHGDLNRTVPNVGSILGKSVDILQLDVGSLKEGEWEEGDHEVMKLGKLAWEY